MSDNADGTEVLSEGGTEALGTEGGEHAESDATQTSSDTNAPRFTVKVRGQEVEVTQDELINGYQRQADYTKSKQELATERQRLEAAEALWNELHNDPKGVLEAIQEHFAEQLTGEPPDPRDQRIAEVESFVEEQRAAAVERQVMAEVERLQTEFGDFNADELLEYAIENQIPNLEAAYLHRERAAERAKRNQERVDAKRNAPPVAGGSRAAGSTSEQEAPITDVRSAIAAALKEHGASSLI